MKHFLFFLIIFSFLSLVFANPEANKFAEQGNQAIQKCEFEQASEYYKKASEAAQDNPEYKDKAMLLRNIIRIRENLAKENNIRRWANNAMSLRAFYMQEKLYSEVLNISQQIYSRFASNPVALFMLGESYILCQQYQQAVEFLSKLGESSTQTTEVLLGIAQAKLGNKDAATTISKQLSQMPSHQPSYCYYAAILETLLQNPNRALQYIANGLKNTPPSQIETLKKKILESPELQTLKENPQFTTTLATESEIKESNCSGGSSCSTCPNRSGCGKN